MSNILALVTNPEATGLIVLWNLLTWFVILPGTAYHFHLKHKQYTASARTARGPRCRSSTICRRATNPTRYRASEIASSRRAVVGLPNGAVI